MDVVLAQIFGLFLLIVGFGMLLNSTLFIAAFEDVKRSPGVRVISALFPVLIGAVIIVLHPVIVVDWTLSISILGYGLFILGALRYWFIKRYIGLITPVMGKVWIRFLGVVLMLWGGFMVFHGFPMVADYLVS
ncbi:MAG: hypothetical protein VXW87_01160 [Pseudomonadota bacterium]|nr:hypothetical protein [Pseudomonadota bacterium]